MRTRWRSRSAGCPSSSLHSDANHSSAPTTTGPSPTFPGLTLRLDRAESRSDEIDAARGAARRRLGARGRAAEELTALARPEPAADPSERLLELSLRIDRTAGDSHDRIAALAAELREEVAAKSAGLDCSRPARRGRCAAAAGSSRRRRRQRRPSPAPRRRPRSSTSRSARWRGGSTSSSACVTPTRRSHGSRTSASRRGWRISVRFRLDDEALDRLAAEVAELTRRVEQLGSIGDQSARVVERAVLDGLADFGKQLTGQGAEARQAGEAPAPFDRCARGCDRGSRRRDRRQGPASEDGRSEPEG